MTRLADVHLTHLTGKLYTIGHLCHAVVVQLVERVVANDEVAGSNPVHRSS